MGELKPCPFCGIEMSEFSDGNFGHKVALDKHGSESKCVLRGQLFDVSERKAWNTRIPPATASKGVDFNKLDRFIMNIDNQFLTPSNRKGLATAIKEAINKGELK